MRRPDPRDIDLDFPNRYALDEARFTGGRERIRNKEGIPYGSTTHLP